MGRSSGSRRHARRRRRRLAAPVVVWLSLMVAALGVGLYTMTRPGSSPRLRQAVGAHRPVVTVSSTTVVPTTTTPPPPAEPGGGLTLFPSHRLVAFYGLPDRPTLGVLGNLPPGPLWPQLVAAAEPFASPEVVVVPCYELIAFVAQRAPGPAGNYAAQLPVAEIDSYLQVVREHDGMLILDIQPGRSDVLADAEVLEPWLVQPDVGLALDPEWELGPGQHPDEQIGQTSAAEINQVSAWLQQLTVAHDLPQKLLMIHQFRASMVQAKPAVAAQPSLAIAFNMDGFGGTAGKLSVYRTLAEDSRWALGYKLFYASDKPLQTPAQVLALTPPPQIVEYE